MGRTLERASADFKRHEHTSPFRSLRSGEGDFTASGSEFVGGSTSTSQYRPDSSSLNNYFQAVCGGRVQTARSSNIEVCNAGDLLAPAKQTLVASFWRRVYCGDHYTSGSTLRSRKNETGIRMGDGESHATPAQQSSRHRQTMAVRRGQSCFGC